MAKQPVIIEPIIQNLPEPGDRDSAKMYQVANRHQRIMLDLNALNDESLIVKRLAATYKEVPPRVRKLYADPFLAISHHLVFPANSQRRMGYQRHKSRICFYDQAKFGQVYRLLPFHLRNIIRRARQGKVSLV